MRRTRDHDAHVAAWHAWRELLARHIRARSRIDDCWIWRLALNMNSKGEGVPVMALPGQRKIISVRRMAAVVAGLPLSDNDVVVTSCGHRGCVNPEHMRVLSRKQLADEMVASGLMSGCVLRSARRIEAARRNKHVRIDMQTARAIRARYDEIGVIAHVAREFGLSVPHAHSVIRHKSWREVSPFAV